jgi:CheY-like chemotaxis protein
LSPGRILVIDDEPQIRRIMRETLTAAGYEVDDARNGAEGLDKLREFHRILFSSTSTCPRWAAWRSANRSVRDAAELERNAYGDHHHVLLIMLNG